MVISVIVFGGTIHEIVTGLVNLIVKVGGITHVGHV